MTDDNKRKLQQIGVVVKTSATSAERFFACFE